MLVSSIDRSRTLLFSLSAALTFACQRPDSGVKQGDDTAKSATPQVSVGQPPNDDGIQDTIYYLGHSRTHKWKGTLTMAPGCCGFHHVPGPNVPQNEPWGKEHDEVYIDYVLTDNGLWCAIVWPNDAAGGVVFRHFQGTACRGQFHHDAPIMAYLNWDNQPREAKILLVPNQPPRFEVRKLAP